MGRRKASDRPGWQKDIVIERARVLFERAEKEFGEHPERSKRYVEMALKICMRYNITMPSEFKRRFCRACKSLMIPGKSCTVRTNPDQKAVIITCKECGHVSRYPYRREIKAKRSPRGSK